MLPQIDDISIKKPAAYPVGSGRVSMLEVKGYVRDEFYVFLWITDVVLVGILVLETACYVEWCRSYNLEELIDNSGIGDLTCSLQTDVFPVEYSF